MVKWIIKAAHSRKCAEELLAILNEEGLDVGLSVATLIA